MYHSTEIKSKIKNLFDICKISHLTISSVESFTGGLFSALLTSIPGSSNYFIGSVVSYNSSVKELIGVDKSIIDKYTVVSQEVAEEMAKSGSKLFNTDICVSFTGNAGPTSDIGDKSVGLFYISILYKGKVTTISSLLHLERNKLREKAVLIALEKIIEIIL